LVKSEFFCAKDRKQNIDPIFLRRSEPPTLHQKFITKRDQAERHFQAQRSCLDIASDSKLRVYSMD